MYSLGIDLGSSSVKVALVDAGFGTPPVLVRYPEQEMSISSPHTGWAEQHPDDWWAYAVLGIQKVLAESGIKPSEIRSIGIAYQMHGLVVVGKDGRPLRPSIIWCDSRAVQSGDEMSAALPPDIIRSRLFNRFGNFTAAKLKWVKDHEPQIFGQIYKIMLPGDYIAYKMSNQFTSTFTGMSEGIFWDFPANKVSTEVAELIGISPDLFPELGSSYDVLARTDESFESLTGIPKGTPISYRSGDQPNNAFALGVLRDGEAAGTAGTSGVIYGVSKSINFDEQARVNTFAHVNHSLTAPSYGTLLCINGTGIMYQWIRKNFFPDATYAECEQIATLVSSAGVLSLPFGNGAERILENRTPGACFHGLDLNRHDKRNLLRAGLEGIAFSFVYGLGILQEMGIRISSMRVGADNLFQSGILAQVIADLGDLQIDIYETTGAIGAAKGSAYGAGLIDNLDNAHRDLSPSRSYTPGKETDDTKDTYEKWRSLLNNNL